MWTRFEYVGKYAAGCNYVFAFETQASLFEEDGFLYVAFTRNANNVVFGTGATFAFQRIGHVGHSLGLG